MQAGRGNRGLSFKIQAIRTVGWFSSTRCSFILIAHILEFRKEIDNGGILLYTLGILAYPMEEENEGGNDHEIHCLYNGSCAVAWIV